MSPLLEIRDLRAWYGASQVLHGVDLRIEAGEAVALAGRNGSGRSTLAKAIMGFVRTQGVIRFAGQSLEGRRAFEIARLGIGYVAEQRDVFPTLTVHENLQLGLKPRNGGRAARLIPYEFRATGVRPRFAQEAATLGHQFARDAFNPQVPL